MSLCKRTDCGLTHDSDVRPLHGLIQIGVLKHQKRTLTARLECDVLHVDGGGTHDVAASRGASCESNLVDSLVSGEDRSSGLAVSRHDVDDAGRESCFLDERGQVECRQRCLFCRLENDCVATCQSRALRTSVSRRFCSCGSLVFLTQFPCSHLDVLD
jgi:hypothetical protein